MGKAPIIGTHLATLNLFREPDGTVEITVADGWGVLNEMTPQEKGEMRPIDYLEPLICQAADRMKERYIGRPEGPSRLEVAGQALIRAAQYYEDAAHENETMMDACVEDTRSNEMATELRRRAVALNADVKSLLVVNRDQAA